MYRGNSEIRKCIKCNKSYEQQQGTLEIKNHLYNICPFCGGNTAPDFEANQKKSETRQRKLEKLYEKAFNN